MSTPYGPQAPGPGPQAPRPLAPAGTSPSGWARLGRAMRPRGTRSQVLAGVLCGLLGFAVVVQVGQTAGADLGSLREADLVRILDDVGERQERLDAESARLVATREELLTSSDRREAARDAARERSQLLAILAGTVPAVGPGIRLVIGDPDGEVPARVLLDAVQELRNAGAEAMQLAGTTGQGDAVRVVASTAFVDAAGGIEVDGTLVQPGYELLVIGDPATLSTALGIPGGVLVAIDTAGGRATVTELDEVRITALRQLSDAEYARPADPAEPAAP